MKEITVIADPVISYETSPIIFDNYDELEQSLSEKLKRYENYQVTVDSYSTDKKIRTELNKLKNALEDKRKAVKSGYIRPLDEFENKIKKLVNQIDDTIEPITNGIKEFDEKDRRDRHEQRYNHMAEIAQAADVDPNLIAWNSSWDNKTFNNSKFEENINHQIDHILNERQRFEENKVVIEDKAKALQLAPKTFVDSLAYKDLPTILRDIDYAKEQVEQLKEETRKRNEAKVAADKADEIVKGDKVINKSTGEIKDEIRRWNISTVGTKTQLMKLKAFLLENDIKYEVLS